MVGRPDLAADERYNNPVGAKEHTAELVKIFEEEFRKITQEELIARLKAADIAYEKINHAADAVTDPQALANKYIVEYTHRGGQKTMTTVPPVKFDTIDVEFRYDYPLVGEHTAEILRDLGYTDGQIKGWCDSGVCYTR